VIELRVQAGLGSASSLMAIKALSWDHPGDEELTLLVWTPAGDRRLGLGPVWGYSGSEVCMAALSEFGEPRLVDADGTRLHSEE
jgi:hypothetical protein